MVMVEGVAAAERLPRGAARPCVPCACARRAAALIARAPLASRGCPPEECLLFPRMASQDGCGGAELAYRHTSRKLGAARKEACKAPIVPIRVLIIVSVSQKARALARCSRKRVTTS